MPTLKANQRCPIPGHGFKCQCARVSETPRPKNAGKWEQVRIGIRRIRDEHADHPDGYRYRLSPAEMRKVLERKIKEQNGMCALCGKAMTDYSNIAPDHRLPKGAGGARRDDREENIQAVHHEPCNAEKGSKR